MIAVQYDLKPSLQDAHEKLANYYTAVGATENALTHFEKSRTLREEIRHAKTEEDVKKMTLLHRAQLIDKKRGPI